ncbi:MAG: KAP family P-loop NTPase fold protein [Mucilaginibacter sp.]
MGIIYFIYRLPYQFWPLTSFYIAPQFKYADILDIYAVFIFFLSMRTKKQVPLKQTIAGMQLDQSIGANGGDLFNYAEYVAVLAKAIIGNYQSESFAIGVNGSWGTGKTSFLDLLKRKLMSQQDIICTDFDPWRYSNSPALIRSFFQTVRQALKPYHNRLSGLFLRYTDMLLNNSGPDLLKNVAGLFSLLTDYDSPSALYNEINAAITSTGKQLVIFIDDVDRLNKEEIIEVIRLIRNTANFGHVFFIVAYDRNYVLNALAEFNDYNHHQFLEKIFQLEISLPHYDKKVLQTELSKKLVAIAPSSEHEEIQKEIIGTPSIIPTYLVEWLNNLRDVTRLTNAMFLNMSGLWGEVVLREMLQLELLRIKYPAVYRLLHEKRGDFMENNDDRVGPDYHFKRSDAGAKGLSDPDTKGATIFYDYLKTHYEDLAINKKEINKVYDLAYGVFGEKGINSRPSSPLSVRMPDRFYLYFRYQLSQAELSEKEFLAVLDQPLESIKKQTDTWINNRLESELQQRWKAVGAFKDVQQFETSVRAIFYMANQPSHTRRSGNVVGYDGVDLVGKMNWRDSVTLKPLYRSDLAAYRQFVEALFAEEQLPFTFVSSFICDLIQSFDIDKIFPIDKQTLINLNVSYLKRYAVQSDELTWELWGLYHNCKYQEWIQETKGMFRGQKMMAEAANTTFRELIETKYLDGYLRDILQQQPFMNHTFSIGPTVEEIFGSLTAFITFVRGQKDNPKWQYVEEFLQFTEQGDFQETRGATFEFKKIPVRRGTW